MTTSFRAPLAWLATLLLLAGIAGGATAAPSGHQTFASPQADPIALSPDGSRLYVANTSSGTVDVIDVDPESASANRVIATVPAGLDPVGLAVRPDGGELWVSNHVSDSVSVIDIGPGSPTQHQVVATVQAIDPDTRATRFDEPVGVAFAEDGSKAYVALSSTDEVAVVDARTYTVTRRLPILGQDPRALAVRDGLLYVAVFESGNQTQLSVCPDLLAFANGDARVVAGEPPKCTLSIGDLFDFVTNPQLTGRPVNVVVDPDLPDRDLVIFDTSDDSQVDTVTGLGTLLYGVAVDGDGTAFVTLTDARNEAVAGQGEGLLTLQNRIFLNQVGRVECGPAGCGAPEVLDLEPRPETGDPADGSQLATPYGVALSGDDRTLVATAAATSRIFTLDTASGAVLDVLDLDGGDAAAFGQQIPRGVALRSAASGAPETAFVLNTLENTVSVVDVTQPGELRHVEKIAVGDDPTSDAVRRGRIAFNNAFASSTGTFACASCHPDGNTDQLLWVIGAQCTFEGCDQEEPRSTMPVRGLRGTLPLHWDGVLGDPIGGPNGETGLGGSAPPNCDGDRPVTCFRQLVDASLSGVMCDQSDGCPSGGLLSDGERDAMARFLMNVSYPPARERPFDDALTETAVAGFEDFFRDQGGGASNVEVTTCGDAGNGCHALPLMTGSARPDNLSVVGGFDAPTMRGLNDRPLLFSAGVTLIDGLLQSTLAFPAIGVDVPPEFIWDPANPHVDERVSLTVSFFAFEPLYNVGPTNIFQMVQEGSTGFSGAAGRQVTLNRETTRGARLAETQALLDALEAADRQGVVELQAEGAGGGRHGTLSFQRRVYRGERGPALRRSTLVEQARSGRSVVTITARLPENAGASDFPQPLLSPTEADRESVLEEGEDPALPVVDARGSTFELAGENVRRGSRLFLDGRRLTRGEGRIQCASRRYAPFCEPLAGRSLPTVRVTLGRTLTRSLEPGTHLLQVQSPDGLLSNELPITRASDG